MIAGMLITIKALAAIGIIFFYILSALVILLFSFDAKTRRQRLISNASFFSRLALSAVGARVNVKNAGRMRRIRGATLIVSNHVSSLDILVLSSIIPSVFVTSVELGSTFPAGLIARLAGSIFVERRRPAGLRREVSEISSVLGLGLPVTLFPEGTTSGGEGVRPFKNSLFEAALKAGTEILPVCIIYKAVDGIPITEHSRDRIFYYGGMKFLTHVKRLISVKRIDVDLHILEPLTPGHHDSRKQLAELSHRMISSTYKCPFRSTRSALKS